MTRLICLVSICLKCFSSDKPQTFFTNAFRYDFIHLRATILCPVTHVPNEPVQKSVAAVCCP